MSATEKLTLDTWYYDDGLRSEYYRTPFDLSKVTMLVQKKQMGYYRAVLEVMPQAFRDKVYAKYGDATVIEEYWNEETSQFEKRA